LVAIRKLRLKSGEIPDPACTFDLEHRVVNGRVDLSVSFLQMGNNRIVYLEELVNDRVKLVSARQLKCPPKVKLTNGSREVKPFTSFSISCFTLLESIVLYSI